MKMCFYLCVKIYNQICLKCKIIYLNVKFTIQNMFYDYLIGHINTIITILKYNP